MTERHVIWNLRQLYVAADSMRILVAGRSWCSISLPPQPQQHFFEPSEIGSASASPGNSPALRVLEFDDVADSFPSGSLCERRLKVLEVIHLLVPISNRISSAILPRRHKKRRTCFPGWISPFWQRILHKIDRWQLLPW